MKRYTNEDIREFEVAVEEMTAIMQESKLHHGTRKALKNLSAWPALDNNNNPYHAYRFGVALAGSPSRSMDKEGPIGGNFVTLAYTDGDQEILDGAAKSIGVSSSSLGSSKKSSELDDVHKVSPVANKKRNRYGI
jgi:hypothetical protein